LSLCPLLAGAVSACQPPGELSHAGDPGPSAPIMAPEQLAAELDQALSGACPMAATDDAQALQSCADALTDLPLLRSRMSAPFDWGSQASPADRTLEQSPRTDFNPRIFRRLYLATFMFPGGHSVEVVGNTAIIRVPIVFRTDLDPGNFPYPFWHSASKWQSYQTATSILFFVRDDKLIGALRSAEQDDSRSRREMKWDGRWIWKSNRGDEPRVSLFSYAFSAQNPHVEELDRRYRAMEKELRRENCLSCHSPDNTARMNPLELFSYPNQALSGRKELISVLDRNTMPPTEDAIPDPERRAELLALARAFAETGDAALEFEESAADATAPR
jgi:hypothetical protein